MIHSRRDSEYMGDDSRLLKKYVRDGSEEAFSRLVDRYLRLVYTTCLRELKDTDLASDATQATFLLLARKSNRLKLKDNSMDNGLASWLFATAYNVSRTLNRQEMRRKNIENRALSQKQIHIDTSAADNQQIVLDSLNEAMKRLGQKEISLLDLRFYQERSLADIGNVLGITEDAARKRVSRALESLRKAYRQIGAVVTVTIIIDVLTQQSAQAAPLDIAVTLKSVACGSIAGSSTVASLTERTISVMKVAQLKIACGIGVVLLGGTGITAAVIHANTKSLNAYQRKNPNPNAYNYYMRAANSLQYTDLISKSSPNSLPNNAQQIVSANGTSIQTMKEGFKYTYETPDNDDPMKSAPALRNLGRMCALKSTTLNAAGNSSGATEAAIDTIKLGTDLPHGSNLITALVGYAINAVGRKSAISSMASLSSVDAIKASQRLEAISDTRATIAEIIASEAYFCNRTMDKDPASAIMRSSYNAYINDVLGEAAKPYPQRKPVTPSSTMAQIGAPAFTGFIVRDADDQAQTEMLALSYALYAYYTDHKSYPKDLKELAPKYISKVPADPFTVSSPIGYKLNGKQCILYSVGPDGVDNNGTAINDPGARSPMSVTDKSQGDIVFGVNG